MNESRPNQVSPYRPMMTVLALVVVVPLLLCGGLLTWFFGRYSVAAKELAIRTEELKRSGVPVDDVTLETFHHSITSDEFTEQWVAAAKQVVSEDFVQQSSQMPYFAEVNPVPPTGDLWPEQEDVTAFLGRWESLLKTIHEIAEAELDPQRLPVRRPITFDGIATLLPDTQEARSFARLVALEHDVALRQRDGDRAFACIQAAQGLRRSFDGEPLLISQLVGVAIGTMTNEMLQRSIGQDILSEQQLIEIDANIPEFKKASELLRLGMTGEVATALPVFTDPTKASEVMEMESSSATARVLGKLRSIDGIFYLDEMKKIESFPSNDLQALRDAGQNWNADMKAAFGNASAAERADKMMTFLIMPAFGAAAVAFAREAEHNNLARLAIAVRLFRYRFDRWPQSLDELNQIKVDPESVKSAGDKSFGYRIEDDGVVLWGVDRREQGEIPDQPPVVESGDDPQAPWVWRIPN